jgi:hypothetical protein
LAFLNVDNKPIVFYTRTGVKASELEEEQQK